MLLGTVLAAPACRRRPTPTATPVVLLAGTVARAAGGPLPGAWVALTGDPDDGRVPLATVRTAPNGTFRIDRVPLGRYRLRVRASGFVDTGLPVQVRGSVAPPAVAVRMFPTVALAGRIQDGRGTPIPLARVLAFELPDARSDAKPDEQTDLPRPTNVTAPLHLGDLAARQTIHETRADQHGAFKVIGLASGAHRLLIEAPGLGTATAGPVQAPDDNVVVVVPGEIRAIVGRVTRGGQAVRGARVVLGGEAVPDPRTVEADSEGRFAFAGVGPGNYALRAEAGGLVTPVLKDVVVARARGPSRPVELGLVPGLYARGQVIGDGGRGVAGASVQIDLVPATGLWPPQSTDSEGRWTSGPLGAGIYRVRARRDGFVARKAATISVPPAVAPDAIALTPVTLELIRAGKIIGRVVDERGRPVVGATIHDRLAETEDLGVIWARLPLAAEAAAMPAGTILPSLSSRATSRRAISDASGAFVLDDVPPGRVEVEVLNASSVPLRTGAQTLAPGATLDVGTLRVQGAVLLAGRVVDAEGRGVTGARVTAASPPPGSGAGTNGAAAAGVTGLYAVSGPEGEFTLPLPAGEHRLTASAPGHGDVTATVRVPPTAAGTPDAGATTTTLRLGRGGGALNGVLEGVVHDSEGRPLARARITAHAPGTPPHAAPLASAVADAGGGFQLTGLPAVLAVSLGGGAIITVQHDGYAPYRQVIAPDAVGVPLRIVVPLPGGIDGEVHERITGAPIPKFHIEARGPDGAQARFPDPSGGRRNGGGAGGPLRFSLRRLTPGPWTLRLEARGYRPLEQTIEVTPATSPGDASVRDLRLEMERS
ncbi:MAG: carboxypeptidase-like regulatory domain-containing protein [Myxococcales bacterium]